MKLYNTLTRRLEEFKPLRQAQGKLSGEVGIYSCGPTVYWNQHIGNMYAFSTWDFLVRSLRYLGYQVKWVMNITDVGHMTSEEDWGDDKMEKGAIRENLSVWDIANKYIQQFLDSMDALGIQRPDVLPRATDHIAEQIELIKKIEKNGFTYRTQTGIVFDTSKFAHYADFAKLNLDEQKSGARVEVDEEKKNPWDFLLWVTNQPNHIMQWDSPWGRGFPGWHIECTAMSIKYLGEQFDIHTGGKEHIPVHHTNEIAQGFGAFGRQTANFWLHNEWLVVKGTKASKSLGNVFLVSDITDKGISPLALRYLYMTSHYRTGLNFTWESLAGAQTALNRLYEICQKLAIREQGGEPIPPTRWKQWRERFKEAIGNDLNMPQVIALVWEMLKSDIEDAVKYKLLLGWDRVLGLKLGEASKVSPVSEAPEEVKGLAEEREKLRKEKKWQEADEVRKRVEKLGWIIEDTEEGYNIKQLARLR